MPKSGFTLNAAHVLSRWRGIGDAIFDAGESNMQEAVDLLQQEIQSRAPVDTGHLRNSYDTRVEETSTGVKGHVWSDADYAAAQEYGTAYQSGTPHVRPAVDARRDELIEIIGDQTIAAAIDGA